MDSETLTRRTLQEYAVALAILTAAFFCRVAGQLLVALFDVDFLPPMEAWDSGLLRYSLLVVAQVVILIVQVRIVWRLWHGTALEPGAKPGLGSGLAWFSAAYFAVMFARWIVTVWLPVELPWSPAVIPIYFHWVLALWVYVFSRYYRALPLRPWRSDTAGAG